MILQERIKQRSKRKTKYFTYGSAFAGIGGMSLGLGNLGGVGAAAWEHDPIAKKVQPAQLAHSLLHPQIPLYGDIHLANPAKLPYFDLLCFTPPCQAFSIAGKHGGFADTRGTLTFEALRIANHIKPRALLMENVKGLVGHDKGNTLSTIVHAINEIGYVVDFTILNSKYFDVAQNRERIYLVAIRDDIIDVEEWEDVPKKSTLSRMKKRIQAEEARTFNFDWPPQEEVRTRLYEFLETNVDDKYFIPPKMAERLLPQLKEKERGTDDTIPEKLGSLWGSGQAGRLWNVQKIAPTIKTPSGGYSEPLIEHGELMIQDSEAFGLPVRSFTPCPHYGIRKLTARECLRLQAVPEEAIDTLAERFTEKQLYQFAGNGLTTNVVEAIGERLLQYL